jgi:hypothetical protein
VPVLGGVNVFALSAQGPSATSHGAVSLDLPASLGDPKQLVGAFGSRPGGATVNLTWCKPAPKVALDRARLPRLTSLGERCWSGAVRTGKKLRPLVLVDWTAERMSVYGTDDCSPA